jgi:peptidoglycan lytic transglycosylase G
LAASAPVGKPTDQSRVAPAEPKRITPRSPRAALEPEPVAVVPDRRSKRTRNPLVIVGNAVLTLLILAALAGGIALAMGKHRFEAPGPLDQDKVVNIPARLSILEIADLLRREGVMDEHPMIFVGGVFALKARADLKSGEYLFTKHASVRDVVETMVDGKVVQHSITIPEGLTSEQIVRRLLETDFLTGNIREIPHEGSLLPESYRFPRGTTREQALQRMQRDQRRVVQENWDRRAPDLPLKTPEQLIILASIIEKETSKPEERTRVAAVFVNRLKQKKRLESDPTIIYGLVGGKGTLGHPISKAEKEMPSPYNTYIIDGLPPGPIANPGRASIEAAANPARTKEMFFVADGTGGHVFADTYDQHQRNVARLRGIEAVERNAVVVSPPDGESGEAATLPGPVQSRQKRAVSKKR